MHDDSASYFESRPDVQKSRETETEAGRKILLDAIILSSSCFFSFNVYAKNHTLLLT